MDQDIAQAAPTYDYDRAFRIIAAIHRAVSSAEFHAGVLYGYERAGRPDSGALFTAAVEEQRRFAQDEAEFGTRLGALRAWILRTVRSAR